MESTNKKRTAVVAAATAAALVLTGTFAWVMKNDLTKLNKFTAKDPGTYEVELKEDFDPDAPWDNKDVWVENKGDNPVIVRVRLEEFYDLEYRNGTTYNIKEGLANGDSDGKAIFNVPGGSELADDLTADSSTGIDKNVILKFGENGTGVTTMEKWNAMEADAKAAVKWVIDTDGWCYYTKALLYGEKTSYLLDDVDFNEDLFLKSHSKPYNLDYKINVRLQAISADLEDFGSHLNDMQWTNVAYIDDNGVEHSDNKGRVIAEDERDDNYEILDDSTITNNAMALVTGIAYPYATPYTEGFKNADGSVAVRVSTAQELLDAMKNRKVHSILLTDDVIIDDWSKLSDPFLVLHSAFGNKMIDLGEYSIKCTQPTPYGHALFFVAAGSPKLSIKHGNIELPNIPVYQCNGVSSPGYLELVGVEITGAKSLVSRGYLPAKSDVKIYGSSIDATEEITAVLSDTNILVSDSQLISRTQSVFPLNGNHFDDTDPKRVNITLETRSSDPAKRTLIKTMSTNSGSYAIWAGEDWTINAKDVTIEAVEKAITENHECGAPKEVNLCGCTINSGQIGYYKVTDSPLSMKDCEVNVTSASGKSGIGLFLRSGNISLDTVNVNVNKGDSGLEIFSNGFTMGSVSYQDLDDYYGKNMGSCRGNYEALQIILNSYESLNVNIIGGSYKTNVAGAESVYAFDATTGTEHGTLHWNDGYDYNNTITISGDPTFTPATTAFDTDYANTTIIKND